MTLSITEAGNNSPVLMQLIYKRLGVPTEEEWPEFRNLPNFVEKAPSSKMTPEDLVIPKLQKTK